MERGQSDQSEFESRKLPDNRSMRSNVVNLSFPTSSFAFPSPALSLKAFKKGPISHEQPTQMSSRWPGSKDDEDGGRKASEHKDATAAMTTPPPDATDAAVADHAAATYSPLTSASGRPSATSPPPKSYPVALQISTPLSFPSMFNQHQQQYQHQQYLNRHQCQPGIAQAMLVRLSTPSMSSVNSNLSSTTTSMESTPLQTSTQEDDDDD
ncbi:hypothetical protein BDZ97DRAFT_1919516 [Flammula alnicola]|nr:hypothetical protein BDZ97DRAFT_1919516 [Flammula alnicola]